MSAVVAVLVAVTSLDWGAIDPELEVGVPEVGVPEVGVPEVGVPEVGVPEVGVPEVGVPEVDVPEVDVPEVDVPEVDVPEVDVPEVDVPEVGGAISQPGWEIVLESNVTAPSLASRRPWMVAPVVAVIEVCAMIVPTKLVAVPRVAELPTCQNTLQA